MKQQSSASKWIMIGSMMIACAGTGFAQATWTGGGNGIWDATSETSDWSGGVPSQGGLGAKISGAYTVPIDGTVDAEYLVMGGGAVLNLGDGDSLTYTGDGLIASSSFGGANATINQTGGTFYQSGAKGLMIGYNRGGGVYNLSGGTCTVVKAVFCGYSAGGSGTFNVSGSGMLNANTYVALGRVAGSAGFMTIQGNADVNIASDFRVGLLDDGDLTVTGGGATIDVSTNMTFDLGTSELIANIDATGFSTIRVAKKIGYNGNLTVSITGPIAHGQQWKLIDANGLLAGFGAQFVNAPDGAKVFDNGAYGAYVSYGADGDVVITALEADVVTLVNGGFETTAGVNIGSGIESVNGYGWTAENMTTEIQNASAPNGFTGITMSGARWGRVVADVAKAGALHQRMGVMVPGRTYVLTGDAVGGTGVGSTYKPVFELRRRGPTGAILASQALDLASGVSGAVKLSYQSVTADADQVLCVRVYHPVLPSGQASRGGIDELALRWSLQGTIILVH
jgi:hypothetical protein